MLHHIKTIIIIIFLNADYYNYNYKEKQYLKILIFFCAIRKLSRRKLTILAMLINLFIQNNSFFTTTLQF